MVYLFAFFAFTSLVGLFLQSKARNGHGMFFSGVMIGIWVLAALWAAGKI